MPAETRYTTTEREALAIVTMVSKCRHYLFGRRFTLVTDHNALLYIFGDEAAAPVTASGELRHGGRLMRWALQLAAYDFEMCHVPGTRMGIPDYLSRFASASVTPLEATEIAGWFAHPWKRSWDLEKMTFLTIPIFPVLPQQQITLEFLLQLQRQDSILEAIREAVSTKDLEAAKGKLLAIYNSTRSLEQQAGHLPHNWKGIDLTRFEIGTGGLLFRRETRDATEEPFLQLVLPPQMRRAFLVEKHDGNHSGHPGSKRTFKKLWPKYWWPDMEAEVALFVSRCEKCLRVKPTRGRWTNGPMRPLPVVYQPFERVSVDMVTVQKNNAKYKHILVMVDHATRYLEAVALKDLTEQTVGEAIYHRLFERYGPVAVILSDRGKQFTEFAGRSLWRAMGARHVATSPYHPETNGANERTNSTLLAFLRAFAEGDLANWYRYLGAAQYAYNTTYHTTLRATPFFLMYNRDPVDALDQLLDQALLTPEQNEARLDNLQLAEWVHQGQTARFYAQQQMMATQQAMADRANKNRRDAPEIQVGSTVYFKPREPYKAKLSSYGLGVFRVTERNDNSLKLVDAHNKERVANIRDLIAIPQETEAKTELQTFQLLQALLHENNQRPETAATEMESETLLAPELLDAPESSFTVHHPWEEGPREEDDEELPALEEVKALEQNVTPAELPRQVLMGLFDDIAALVPTVHPASAPKRLDEEVRATEAPARSKPALPVLSAIQSVPHKLVPQLPRRSQRNKMAEKETNPFLNVTVKNQELYVQLQDKTWLPFGQTPNPDKWRWLRLLRQDSSNPSWYFPALCQMTDQMLLEETEIQKGSSV